MRRHATLMLLLGVLIAPISADAQLLPPVTQFMGTQTAAPVPTGEVDIVIEALTYKPSFYRGRAEPTAGNTVRLVAVPLGRDPADLTYQWSVDGRPLPSTGQVATFSSLFGGNVRITVSVTDQTGALFAQAEEVMRFSAPEVVFYEENLLRGHGSKAISGTYTLIGDEGVVRAEPYFVGLNVSPASYQVAWRVNDTPVVSGGDWRELLLRRPEDASRSYLIDFSVANRDNLAERASGRFNINFGL